jgi:hypothetical protein
MYKTVIGLTIISVMFLSLLSAPATAGPQFPSPDGKFFGKSVNRVLAIVGDSVITLREYQEEFADTTLSKDRLEDLIDQTLINLAAADMGVSVSEQQARQLVDRRLEAMISSGGVEEFKQYLAAQNMTEDEFREQMLQQSQTEILLMRVLSRAFPEFSSPDTVTAAARVRARLMIIPEQKQAKKVFEKLQENPSEENWNRLYKKYSRPRWFVGENGRLGWFGWGSFHTEIEYRVFKLSLYGLSEPFEWRGDYLIVWKTGVKLPESGKRPSMEDLEYFEQLRQRYYQGKLLKMLREHYAVDIPDSVRRRLGGE